MYLTPATRCSQVLHVSTGTWLSVLVFLVGVLEAPMLVPLTLTLTLTLTPTLTLTLTLTLDG